MNIILQYDPSILIDEASEGDEAFLLLSDFRYDLLLTDIRMPGMNGLKLGAYALDNDRADSVVILTGYADFGFALEALRIGVTDYLLKPVDAESLYHILDTIEDSAAPKYEDELVDRLVTLIRHSLDRKIRIADLCREHLFLHPAYVSRYYKQVTGETIIATIQRLRMERGMQLLKNSQLTISEVAARCGYGEASAFSQLFKRRYGMTPKELRQER